MDKKHEGNPLIFEGKENEQYKLLRNKWIRLSIVGTVLPLFLSCLVSWYNGRIELLDMADHGEIVMSLFSLTVPLIFDLFEIKKQNDEIISNAFFICVLVVLLQMVFYCLIRIDNSNWHLLKGIITSIVMILASWACCMNSIRAMYLYASKAGGNQQ